MPSRLLFVPLLLLTIACPFGKADGDDDDDDDDDDDGGQTDACADYVDCLNEVTPDQEEITEETYGEDGTCWDQGDEYADACDQNCEAGLESMQAMYPDADACGGGGGPAECPGEDGDWSVNLELQ